MNNAPEKIRVAQDSDGFWTCREAISGSQEYTRSDLVAELAAENERLRNKLELARNDIDKIRRLSITYDMDGNGGYAIIQERACEAYNKLTPTGSSPYLASTGAVKELEWARGWMNAEAQTEIGQYTITYRRDGSFEWGIGILKGWASSWDAAKSAAQADYERRIISALVPRHQVKHNT